jgi:hypothetical protein
MGSSSSKVAGKAAAAAGRRQYPSTASILYNASSTSNPSGSQATTPPGAIRPNRRDAPLSEAKSEHVDLDGRDPQFSSKLRALGPAVPVAHAQPQEGAFPTSSQPPLGQQAGVQNIFPGTSKISGVTNPAIVVVNARERIGKLWEEERDALGRGSFAGRTMLCAGELSEIIQLRDDGMVDGEIEKKMRLRRGLVGRLGVRGVVANV